MNIGNFKLWGMVSSLTILCNCTARKPALSEEKNNLAYPNDSLIQYENGASKKSESNDYWMDRQGMLFMYPSFYRSREQELNFENPKSIPEKTGEAILQNINYREATR